MAAISHLINGYIYVHYCELNIVKVRKVQETIIVE